MRLTERTAQREHAGTAGEYAPGKSGGRNRMWGGTGNVFCPALPIDEIDDRKFNR